MGKKQERIDVTSGEWSEVMRDMVGRAALANGRGRERVLYDASGAQEESGLNFDQFAVCIEHGVEPEKTAIAARLLEQARAWTPPAGEAEEQEPTLPSWVETEIEAEFLELCHGRTDLGVAQIAMLQEQAERAVLERYNLEATRAHHKCE